MECGREEDVGCRGDHRLPPGISGEGLLIIKTEKDWLGGGMSRVEHRQVQEQMSGRHRRILTVDCDLVDRELRREAWTGMPTWGPAASLRLCLERRCGAWQQPRQSDGSLASWYLEFSPLHPTGLVVSTQTLSLFSYFPFAPKKKSTLKNIHFKHAHKHRKLCLTNRYYCLHNY